MKALHYLLSRKIPLPGNRDSLVRTILWFSPLGNKDLIIYPESTWIDDPSRKKRMLHWLDGTVEDIYTELNQIPVCDLVQMLEDCMDTIVWDHGIESRVKNLHGKMLSGEGWASIWNDFLGVKGENSWDFKFEVIEAYSNENRWGEEAQEIVDICERYLIESS